MCSDLNNKTDKGHQFFEESKRLFQMERGRPKLTTAQALAIMSIRELGLGRDTVGWMYAGMCFQMFFDLELHLKDRTKYHGPDYARLQRGRNVAAWGIYGLEKYVSDLLYHGGALTRYMCRLWCLVLNRSSHLSVPYLPKPEIADRLEHEPWYPYPQVRQTIPLQLHFTFSAHCQLNEILGELLKSCYTNDDEVPLRDIESFFLKLTSWRYTMSDNLQDMEDITPYNLNLLLVYCDYSTSITSLISFQNILSLNHYNFAKKLHNINGYHWEPTCDDISPTFSIIRYRNYQPFMASPQQLYTKENCYLHISPHLHCYSCSSFQFAQTGMY